MEYGTHYIFALWFLSFFLSFYLSIFLFSSPNHSGRRLDVYNTPPANFNGFRVLAALLHSTLIVAVNQTLRR